LFFRKIYPIISSFMASPENIIIVGDGIAGPALANSLAEQGIESTLVVRSKPAASKATSRRLSIPVVNRRIGEKLGVTDTPPINRLAVFFGDRELPFISDIATDETATLLAPDIQAVSNGLVNQAKESPAISVVEGTVRGVMMKEESGKERVTGVVINGEPLAGDVVFDATGREAHIAKLLLKKDESLLKERTRRQPTSYIGGYMQLDTTNLSSKLPSSDTLAIAFLPDIRLLIAPHHLPGSNATHFVLAGGRPDRLQTALQESRKSSEDNRLAALKQLTKGTMWYDLLNWGSNFERTLSFAHRSSVARYSLVDGVAFIGDAGVSLNPTSGVGLRHITEDVEALVGLMATGLTLDKATSAYNTLQEKKNSQRQKKSQRIFRGAQLVGRSARILRRFS
jgi:2-polyprenyl-6-methoxyphenol hydroxylase-like FAD-dependent oxidoreductase